MDKNQSVLINSIYERKELVNSYTNMYWFIIIIKFLSNLDKVESMSIFYFFYNVLYYTKG